MSFLTGKSWQQVEGVEISKTLGTFPAHPACGHPSPPGSLSSSSGCASSVLQVGCVFNQSLSHDTGQLK